MYRGVKFEIHGDKSEWCYVIIMPEGEEPGLDCYTSLGRVVVAAQQEIDRRVENGKT
jgi:hypothetical protein